MKVRLAKLPTLAVSGFCLISRCTYRAHAGLERWLAIIAVPTAITGGYGMNFKHMPEPELSRALPGSRASPAFPQTFA